MKNITITPPPSMERRIVGYYHDNKIILLTRTVSWFVLYHDNSMAERSADSVVIQRAIDEGIPIYEGDTVSFTV